MRTGSQVSDLPTLLTNFENGTYKSNFETAIIKVCTNSNSSSSFFGKLLGHQVAIISHDDHSTNGTPDADKLAWLPGVGITESSSDVTCQ